jgi:hypothetical protein
VSLEHQMTFGERLVLDEDGIKREHRERLLHGVSREIHSSVNSKFAFLGGCQRCQGGTSFTVIGEECVQSLNSECQKVNSPSLIRMVTKLQES